MTLRGALEKLRPYFYKLRGKRIVVGKKCRFRGGIRLNANHGGRIVMGNSVFLNHGCSFNARESIRIDDDVLFGENVCIYDHNHVFDDPSRPIRSQGYRSAGVHIGAGTWICSNVTILKGVTIGKHCVIGAGCLIYRDIPDDSIVKNNSSVTITKRNEDEA